MGMSGGVRRGAESSDVVHPQGITGQMLATAPIAKGKRVRNGKLKGGEKMTGDNYTPNWRQIRERTTGNETCNDARKGGI